MFLVVHCFGAGKVKNIAGNVLLIINLKMAINLEPNVGEILMLFHDLNYCKIFVLFLWFLCKPAIDRAMRTDQFNQPSVFNGFVRGRAISLIAG